MHYYLTFRLIWYVVYGHIHHLINCYSDDEFFWWGGGGGGGILAGGMDLLVGDDAFYDDHDNTWWQYLQQNQDDKEAPLSFTLASYEIRLVVSQMRGRSVNCSATHLVIYTVFCKLTSVSYSLCEGGQTGYWTAYSCHHSVSVSSFQQSRIFNWNGIKTIKCNIFPTTLALALNFVV